MRVKICGITNDSDALLCQQNGADAIGFIFYKKSPRYITPQQAAEITARLSPFMTRVGVFVDEPLEQLLETVARAGLHAVQLHGQESPEYVQHIPLPVIKSFRVTTGFDFSQLDQYPGCHFLLDSYSNKVYGGSGLRFDWNLIPAELRSRIILAGGINAENIVQVFQTIQPAAVDLSSALELEPGKKDSLKVEEFMRVVQQWRSRLANRKGKVSE